MNKKFLNKFTKHLVLASKKTVKEIPKETAKVISREIPKLELEDFAQKLAPQIEVPPVSPHPKEKEIAKTSLEELAKALTAPKNITENTLDNSKIFQFIEDSLISIIECPGPDKKIKVKKVGGVILTEVSLTQQEISEILEYFSAQAKTPLTQIFKAKVRNLSMTAFVSPIAGTKFMILKD
ncbi:hypothetical protein ACFLZZ_03815 [Nanoarchaeota archaeon]